jgi:hypothetical protein
MTSPLDEITIKALTALVREIGPVNTVRFLSQFTTDLGDYTAERDDLFGDLTLDEILAEIKSGVDRVGAEG